MLKLCEVVVTVSHHVKDGVFWIVCTGQVTAAQLLQNRSRMHTDPQVGELPVLVDLSGVTQFAVESPEVWSLAWDRRGGTGPRVAVVAPSREAFGLARMYQLARGQQSDQLQVFQEVAAALNWLDPGPASAA